MSRVLLAIIIAITSVNVWGYELDPQLFQTPQDFAYTARSSFQWWIEPQTHKINFRRCDCDLEGVVKCRRPMLLKGLDSNELQTLLDFYTESLSVSSTYQLKHIGKILVGSFGTITVYAGTITAMSMLKPAVPQRLAQAVTSWPVRRGIHVISIGALALLFYLTAHGLSQLHEQREILDVLNDGRAQNREFPPPLEMKSQDMFEEFMVTFRQALYEYTHGGGGFEENGYLVFQ